VQPWRLLSSERLSLQLSSGPQPSCLYHLPSRRFSFRTIDCLLHKMLYWISSCALGKGTHNILVYIETARTLVNKFFREPPAVPQGTGLAG
jgi:hypothetical protein